MACRVPKLFLISGVLFREFCHFFIMNLFPDIRDGEDDDGEPDDTEARHLRCIERFIVKEDADKK